MSCITMGVFSKTCEYAMRAVFFIAHRTTAGERVGIREIAAGIDSPEAFLAKIMQDLTRRGIVNSIKGPNGGFYMDATSLKKPLSEVVLAVDGDGIFVGCGMGLEYCSAVNPCPLHNEFMEIRTRIQKMMHENTIGDFNEELNLGILSLKK